MTRNSMIAALLAFLSGCNYIPISGGKLDGELTEPPGDWTDVASAKIIRLETNPQDPYSVKLWILGVGADLYVHAGATRTTWVEHIEVDPNVRLLIGEKLYELRAERVTSQDEFDAMALPYKAKYGNAPRNPNIDEAYLFKLLPRS